MRQSRWLVVVLAFAVVFAGVGPAVGAAALTSDAAVVSVGPDATPHQSTSPVAAQTADNESGPGESVAGTLQAENARIVAGDLTARLEGGLADAESDEQRARVAGQVLSDALDRLDRLEARRAELDSGESDPGEAARLRAQATELRSLADRIDGTAANLPSGLRNEHGLTADRIDRLRTGADRLAGDGSAFGPGFYHSLTGMVDRYNERAGSGGFMADRLAGEEINLHVEDGSESTAVSFAIGDDGRIQDLRAGARDDATLRLTTDRATMDEIMAADDPQAAMLAAIDRGDVTFRGLGAVNRVKWFAFGLLDGGADAVRGIADTVRDLA